MGCLKNSAAIAMLLWGMGGCTALLGEYQRELDGDGGDNDTGSDPNHDVPTDGDCVDGDRMNGTVPCGLNDRGVLVLECLDGLWEQTDQCDDPDVCKDDIIEQLSSGCGMNERGTGSRTCVAGQWENACDDPDVCVDGETRSAGGSCGIFDRGIPLEQCQEGQWAVSQLCDDLLKIELVKDINLKGEMHDEKAYGQLTQAGSHFYFVAYEVNRGAELWKTDGTKDGTGIVKDIYPGESSSNPSSLVAFNGVLYFAANDGVHGSELWKSDGTPGGTVMVKDVQPPEVTTGPSDLTVVGNTLFFLADDGQHGLELWKTTGVVGNASMVKDIYVGLDKWSRPYYLTAAGNELFFLGQTDAYGSELWKSDGLEAGTTLVKDINPGANSSTPSGLVYSGSTLYFSADDGSTGRELWKTDGSSSGTVVIDIVEGPNASQASVLGIDGDVLYLSIWTDDKGREVWKSNGTKDGTTLLRDINPGTATANPRDFVVTQSGNYFVADDGTHGESLWKTNGEEAGTVLMKYFDEGDVPGGLLPFGDFVLYTRMREEDFGMGMAQGIEWWITGGPLGNSTLLKDGFTMSSREPGQRFDGDAYAFLRTFTGVGLWKTDGTQAGTVLIKDINPENQDSQIQYLTSVNSDLFFVADDGISGPELWKSDGAEEGTVLVKDIYTGTVAEGETPPSPSNLTAFGDSLFFSAQDLDHGYELWKTDGTAENTIKAEEIIDGLNGGSPQGLTVAGDKLYFSADNQVNGRELWVTDGVPGNATMLELVSGNGGAYPSDFAVVDDTVYFTASYGLNGEAVWKSNGTPDTTTLLAPFDDPVEEVDVKGFSQAGGELYWGVSVKSGWNGESLWKSNGDLLGGDQILTATNRYYHFFYPAQFVLLGDIVVFGAEYNDSGVELWRTDGTDEGTYMIKDICLGVEDSRPTELRVIDGTLYFVANDCTNETQVFTSDGTASGTKMLVNIAHAWGADPSNIIQFGDYIFFVATDMDTNRTLWISDGTTDGTSKLSDITAEYVPFGIRELIVHGDTMYMTAKDAWHGEELWKITYRH